MSKKATVNGNFKDIINTVKFLTERKKFIDSAEAVYRPVPMISV